MAQLILGNDRCYEPSFYSMIMRGFHRWNRNATSERSWCVYNGMGLDKRTLLLSQGVEENAICLERNPFYFREEDPPDTFYNLYRICMRSLCYEKSFPMCFPTIRGRFRQLQKQYSLRDIVPWHISKQGRVYVFLNYNEGFWAGVSVPEVFEETHDSVDTEWARKSIALIETALRFSHRDVVIKWHPLTKHTRSDASSLFIRYSRNPRVTFSSKKERLCDIVDDLSYAVMYAGSSFIPLAMMGKPCVVIRESSDTWFSKTCLLDPSLMQNETNMLNALPEQREALDFIASQTFGRDEIESGELFEQVDNHLRV